MILVFGIANGNVRAITGVTKFYAYGNTFTYHREGMKQPSGFGDTNFGIAWDIDHLLKRYRVIYAICHIRDCARYAVGDGLIKWIAWDGEFIAHMTESEARNYIRDNSEWKQR